jgi:hypothetical protein
VKVHTNVTQANGVISLTVQVTFVGDMTDTNDQALIAALGDPEVNIAGMFTDPSDPTFTFQMPTTELYTGVTTQLSSKVARFMLALPASSNPNQPCPRQGPLDVITPNPARAAKVWQGQVLTMITAAMSALRAKTLVPAIPDATV